MTERLIIIANIYTWYELIGVLAVFIVTMIVGALVAKRRTDSGRLALLFITQPIAYILIFSGFSIIANYYFESVVNGYQQVGLFIGLIVVILNLVLYAMFYNRGKKEKVFDPDHVNRWHFSSSLNTVVLTTILGVTFGFFAPAQLGQVLLVTSMSIVFTVLLNHAIIIRLFRDTSEEESNE